MNYIPLYVYSEYSILHSTCHIERLVSKALEYNMTSLAITDNSSMHGVLKFYKECIKNNISPIIGLDILVQLNDSKVKLLLYAVNNTGYKTLLKLSSYYNLKKEAVPSNLLNDNLDNLICIYPLKENNGYQNIDINRIDINKNHLKDLKYLFNHLYIGFSCNTTNSKNNLDKYVSLYNEYKGVAINQVLYINDNEKEAYQTLRSIDNGSHLINLTEEEQNASFISNDIFNNIFINHQDLIKNTNEIASLCHIDIDFNSYHLPLYDSSIDSLEYLKELALKGLNKRLTQNKIKDQQLYFNRLKYEYDVVVKMGFVDYFLIVWDYVKFAKLNHIYVGPGRGSAGGSLLAYSLGITDCDPIKYNLLFERFLNIERISMPDIDIDFPDDKRDEVIDYVTSRYGKDHVAHVVAFGTFKNKLALNDISRVYNIDDTHSQSVNKIISQDNYKDLSINEIDKTDETIKKLRKEYQDIDKLLSIAEVIYGLPRNLSTHAAAILITKEKLVDYTALMSFNDNIYQTQLEATDIESLGLLKMDFLSLKNLSNIINTFDAIEKDETTFDRNIDENIPQVYKMISSGDLNGVFQTESIGFGKMITELKPTCFMDLVSAIAIYRPGPMKIIPSFIARKHGTEKITYLHKDLEPILKETYGHIVFQEQVMQICQKFAGYSFGKADVVRRAMSKKKMDILEKERINFVNSSINNGYDSSTANTIYDYIVKFGDYGYNKAHSVAYAKIVYLTAYLKCLYPKYYLSVLMDNSLGSSNDILNYIKQLKRKGLFVYIPSISYSTNKFVSTPKGVLFPLTSIKMMSDSKALFIINERTKNKFTSYEDFLKRCNEELGTDLIKEMIHSGCLDEFKISHKSMIDTLDIHINMMKFSTLPGLKEIQYSKDEYSYGELLDFEKESLGLNIKYNFFDSFSNIYKEKNLIKLRDIKVNNLARTLGIVKRIKKITTKSSEEMCFIEIEDDISKCDVTVFPKLFKEISSLKESDIIIVSGRVEERKTISIIADQIIKL